VADAEDDEGEEVVGRGACRLRPPSYLDSGLVADLNEDDDLPCFLLLFFAHGQKTPKAPRFFEP